MTYQCILSHFGYDTDLKLGTEGHNTRLPVSVGELYTLELSGQFLAFLKALFIECAKCKYQFNSEDFQHLLEPVNEVHMALFLEEYAFFKGPGLQVQLNDFLFFWRFFVNANFKHAFLIAKYLGWQKEPLHMVGVIHSQSPFAYFRLRAASASFAKVIAFSRTLSDINSIVGAPKTHRLRMEVGSQRLLRGEPLDIILKCIGYEDIAEGRYSLLGCSSYEVMWIFERNLAELERTLSEVLPKLPPHMPKMFVLTEQIEVVENSLAFEDTPLTFLLTLPPGTSELSDKDRKTLFENTLSLLQHPELGLSREFVQKERQSGGNKLKFVAAGVALAALGAFIFRERIARAITKIRKT